MLGMYIDDGAIFACGKTWSEVDEILRMRYSKCVNWLARAGLNTEPDKLELIYFKKCGEHSEPPPYIHLPLLLHNTYYRVTRSNTLRYLGFFFNSKLNWKHHIKVMCNRTRAMLKALQILGNSVCSLNHARWRLTFNTICLPILTYRCQLWYTGKQKELVKKLQTVQNEAVKIISGTFRTTPREPLHQLLTIFPMEFRLNMLLQNSALWLYKVSQESQLLWRLGGAWHTPDPSDLPLPTPNNLNTTSTLRKLAARVPAMGPHIDPFPNIPADTPAWQGRIKVIPKKND
jgi:hypothetical protein